MTAFVHQLATRHPACCRPDATLATAASLLWEYDCGLLPIVDPDMHVLGVLTDRDLCLALAGRDATASRMLVRDVMRAPVHAVELHATAAEALRLMRQFKVRRLPVIDAQGRLESVISINDLVLASHSAGQLPAPEVSSEAVMAALKAICAHEASGLKELSKVQLITI